MISKIHVLASLILITYIAYHPSRYGLDDDLDRAVMVWCFIAFILVLFLWR